LLAISRVMLAACVVLSPSAAIRAALSGQSPTTPVTCPSTRPQATTAAGERNRSREAAGPLVAVVAIGLLAVMVALMVWVLHWGRRLRQIGVSRSSNGPHAEHDIDPWAEAGRRLKEPDQSDSWEQP